MKIKEITFNNYKIFSELQTLELRPITILIGKNSSGKSAIAKLFTLLETSLRGEIDVPLLLSNREVVLGDEFRDLVYNKYPNQPIEFSIEFEDNRKLSVRIIQLVGSNKTIILTWRLEDNGKDFLLTNTEEEDHYIDKEGLKYQCYFKGFIPNSIKRLDTEEDLSNNLNLEGLAIDIDYIGPFRLMPPRFFSLTGQIRYPYTGIKGENAYYILGNSKRENSSLVEDVGKWYSNHFDGWYLDVSESKSPLLEVVLYKEDKKVQVNIADVGQGMSQALPLIIRAYMEIKSSLIILEQPELHLHPAAHGDLAELFAESALKKQQNYLIETHSENFLLRIRRMIVEDNFALKPEDVIIYWVDKDEDNGNFLEKITIDEKGVLSNWPEGVFTENVQEILAIRKAAKIKTK